MNEFKLSQVVHQIFSIFSTLKISQCWGVEDLPAWPPDLAGLIILPSLGREKQTH